MLKFCYPPDKLKRKAAASSPGFKMIYRVYIYIYTSKLFGGLQLADTNVASGDVNPMYHGSYSECENTTDFPQTSQSFTNI